MGLHHVEAASDSVTLDFIGQSWKNMSSPLGLFQKRETENTSVYLSSIDCVKTS